MKTLKIKLTADVVTLLQEIAGELDVPHDNSDHNFNIVESDVLQTILSIDKKKLKDFIWKNT